MPSPGMYRGGLGVQHVERQALLPWDESSLKAAVEQVKREAAVESRYQQALPAQFVPAIGFVPTHAHLPRTPGQSTPLPNLLT